jgi:hypothetical protein
MSSSRHPIALRLERTVGDPTRLLATVMLLPLIDGIFPALVLAGALDSVAGILQVGILVFGGSATLAIILAEMDGTRREQVTTVLIVGVPLVLLAGIEAALAPAIAEVIDLVTFERFAAVVIGAIAAKTASARIGEYLPRPAVIVGLGFVGSIDPSGAALDAGAVQVQSAAVASGVAAGLVGVGFALSVALLSPWLRSNVAIDRFRFGSAVALGLLALSIVGSEYGQAPLAVIAVTALFTYDPSSDAATGDADASADDEHGDEDEPTVASPPEAPVDEPASAPAKDVAPITDGGPGSERDDAVEGSLDGDKPPWL